MKTARIQVLRKHAKSKLYDRNGTGEPRPVIKKVFVPSNRNGNPALILLCSYSKEDSRGRFEYCIFTDLLFGGKHVPSDSFGYGTKRQALAALKEHVFHSMTDIWPWVIDETWKTTKLLWNAKVNVRSL
jgi:hypothetical protein